MAEVRSCLMHQKAQSHVTGISRGTNCQQAPCVPLSTALHNSCGTYSKGFYWRALGKWGNN